ncbi:MAG: hypothetical protein WCF04_08740 [Candidatus Nanopelagicales bacterium]
MRGSVRCLTAALSVQVLLAGGCAGTGGDGAIPTSWAGAPSADLVPTGLLLAGLPSSTAWDTGRIVADGSGSVWAQGPWSVTRLDPPGGTGTTWDAADDWAFTSAPRLAPSSGTGAWLIGLDRVRLFDGGRFAADVPVPDDVRRADADEATSSLIVDAADVDSELWLSITYIRTGADGQASGRVVRWRGGQWSVMAERGAGVGGPLAVDTDGGVWAGGFTGDGVDGTPPTVQRWDGSGWAKPAPSDPDAPRGAGVVAPDPSGGVWVISSSGGGAQVALSRFDGAAWHAVSADVTEQVGRRVTALDGFGGGLAVALDGSGWVAGSNGIARYAPDGSWQAFTSELGVVIPEGDALPDVTTAGERVLVLTGPEVLQLDGDRFVPLWTAPTGSIQQVTGLSAVSVDEAWSRVRAVTDPRGNRESRWARFRDGQWTPRGPQVTGMGASAVASDGALWATSTQGLLRFSGAAWTVVAQDVRQATASRESTVVAGPDGSAWAGVDGDIVLFQSDGTRMSVGRPAGMAVAVPRAAAADGTVWTSEIGESRLHRWDGAWSTISPPAGSPSICDLVVASDGALWALLVFEQGSALGRYHEGAWLTFPIQGSQSLAATPAAGVCTEAGTTAGIACYDALGLVGTMPFDGFFEGFSIAPDGTVWVRGALVARLAGTAPAR